MTNVLVDDVIYQIEDFKTARNFLSQFKGSVILSNKPGSTRYYGMRIIDFIFKTLKREFPEKIKYIIVETAGDYSAYVTARKLGYSQTSCTLVLGVRVGRL